MRRSTISAKKRAHIQRVKESMWRANRSCRRRPIQEQETTPMGDPIVDPEFDIIDTADLAHGAA